jgi:hypothetical protein
MHSREANPDQIVPCIFKVVRVLYDVSKSMGCMITLTPVEGLNLDRPIRYWVENRKHTSALRVRRPSEAGWHR